MKKNIVLLLLILFVAFLFFLHKGGQAKKFLPDFKDWQKRSDVKVYSRRNLGEYVGVAEKTYLRYGFKELVHQEYIKDYGYIIVDIFRMKNHKSAKNLMYHIKNPNDQNIKIGEMGSKSINQVIFLKKAYYVRVFTFNEDLEFNGELIRFADRIDSKIG